MMETTGNDITPMGERGVKFSSDNQPTPQAKSDGWQARRSQRLLTQAILEKMLQGQEMSDYIDSLILNAKMGNAKAIETINKGIEDDIQKIETISYNIEPTPAEVAKIKAAFDKEL